jgi:hypothetical protein
LLASIRFFNSVVNSLVRNISRSHSSLAFVFNATVCSLSSSRVAGILKEESPYFWLVGQPKKAQLRPGMYLKLKFQYIIQTAPEQSDFLEEIVEPMYIAINIDVLSDEQFASRDTYKQ